MYNESKENFLTAAVDSDAVAANPSGRHLRLAMPFHPIEGVVIFADMVLVVGSSILAGILYHTVAIGRSGDLEAFIGVGAAVYLNFVIISAARTNYKLHLLSNFREQVQEVTAIWFIVCSLLLALAFFFKIGDSYSRGATLLFLVGGWVALICCRAVLALLFFTSTFAAGRFAKKRVVILAAKDFVVGQNTVHELKRCGYRPVRIFKFEGDASSPLERSAREVINDLITICRAEPIEQVFLQVPWQNPRLVEEIMSALRVLSLPVHLLPDDSVAHFLRNRIVNMGGAWTVELKRASLSPIEQAIKRTADLVLATIGLVVLSPLMAAVAAIVVLDSPGPVFFVQTRHGFNGRSFGVRKFRTMRVLEDGPIIRQATRNDPRFTRIGRLLRRTSIDELPQLFNVISGEMSLVGPRPHAAAHNTEYEKLIGKYMYRNYIKPGITGWAQVNGFRGETTSLEMMERRVDFDLWYINNWSFSLDIRILLKTITIAANQTNAY